MHAHSVASQCGHDESNLRAKCLEFVKIVEAYADVEVVGKHSQTLSHPSVSKTGTDLLSDKCHERRGKQGTSRASLLNAPIGGDARLQFVNIEIIRALVQPIQEDFCWSSCDTRLLRKASAMK